MDMSIHYVKCLEAVNKNSNYMEESLRWIRQKIPGIVENILDASAIPEGEKLRIISIGPGEGWPDAAILDEIIKLKKPVLYTAVDPNVEIMKKFRMNVASNSKYAEVEFDLMEMGVEEFLSRDGGKQLFHLIVMIHSSYYFFGRVREVLEDFHKLTEKYGCIMAITIEKDSICRKYDGKLPIADKAFAQDIDVALERGNLSFQKNNGKYYVDIGPMFDCCAEGNLLLDFFTQVQNFREVSEPEFVKEFLEDFKLAAIEEGDKLIYSFPTIIHVIHKH